jgi:hypothetical protein
MLAEGEAKALLARAGVAVPRGVSGATLEEVQARVSVLSAPLALKGMGFAHKTEAGAVRLGLASLVGQAEMPGATGYLAEEMVTGVVAEGLLGLRRDPVYGVTLTLGLGGVTAELLADTVTLVAPVTGEEMGAALRTLRLWPLLDGYRGRARADVAGFVDAALALQAGLQQLLALAVEPGNPLVRHDGRRQRRQRVLRVHHRARRQDQRLARILAHQRPGEHDPRRQIGLQILQRMHREIHPPIQQRLVNLLERVHALGRLGLGGACTGQKHL